MKYPESHIESRKDGWYYYDETQAHAHGPHPSRDEAVLALGVYAFGLTAPRFFLDNDDDGHWYLVPADKRAEWDLWVGDDSNLGDPPEWAQYLNGHCSHIEFVAPQDTRE